MARRSRSRMPRSMVIKLALVGILLLVVGVVSVAISNPTLISDLRSKASGLPQFPITVSPIYRTPGQKWTITYTGPNKYGMNTQLSVITWNCDLYNPKSCTSKATVTPWKWPSGGGPRVMTHGVLTNDTPTTIPVDRVYYVQFRPTSYSSQYGYSKVFATVVTRMTQQYSNNDILNAYQTLINRQRSTYPYETALGIPFYNGSHLYRTMADVDADKSLTPDTKVDFYTRLICGNTIMFNFNYSWNQSQINAWKEQFANLRRCYSAGYAELAENIMWPYMQNPSLKMSASTKDLLTRIFYYMLLQHDILSSRASLNEQPFTKLRTTMKNGLRINWQLGDTNMAKRYLTDNMPVYKAMGYAKQNGWIKQYFCSYVESAHPWECTQIDLYKRARDITQRIYTDRIVRDHWFNRINWTNMSVFPDNQSIWQTTGIALAAKMNSQLKSVTSNQFTKTKALLYHNTDQLAVNWIADYLRHNNVNNGGQADTFQRLTNMMQVENWRTLRSGDPFFNQGAQALTWFHKALFNNGYPVFSNTKDSYIPSLLPPNIIAQCHKGGYFNYTLDNHVVGVRGEPPSSAVLTSVASVRHIAEAIDPLVVPVIRATAMRALNAAIADPHKGSREECSTQGLNHINALWSTIRQSNFLIVGWNAWKKSAMAEF